MLLSKLFPPAKISSIFLYHQKFEDSRLEVSTEQELPKESKQRCRNRKLPEDIIINVLPSKELCRFECVSNLRYKDVSTCRSRIWKSSPRMVGFFFCQNITQLSKPDINGYMFTSMEKFGPRRSVDGTSLDESARFLDGKNGFGFSFEVHRCGRISSSNAT